MVSLLSSAYIMDDGKWMRSTQMSSLCDGIPKQSDIPVNLKCCGLNSSIVITLEAKYLWEVSVSWAIPMKVFGLVGWCKNMVVPRSFGTQLTSGCELTTVPSPVFMLIASTSRGLSLYAKSGFPSGVVESGMNIQFFWSVFLFVPLTHNCRRFVSLAVQLSPEMLKCTWLRCVVPSRIWVMCKTFFPLLPGGVMNMKRGSSGPLNIVRPEWSVNVEQYLTGPRGLSAAPKTTRLSYDQRWWLCHGQKW